MPGERVFLDAGGRGPARREMTIRRSSASVAAKQPNPVKTSPAVRGAGPRATTDVLHALPRAEAKGGNYRPVPRSHPDARPERTPSPEARRTYWHSYIVVGGRRDAWYGEALSSHEAWHIVNYLRSIAQK